MAQGPEEYMYGQNPEGRTGDEYIEVYTVYADAREDGRGTEEANHESLKQ